MKKRSYSFAKGAIAGLLLIIGIWIAGQVYEGQKPGYSFQPGMSISEPQIRKVCEAIGTFSKEYNRRPDRLEMLTAGGYLKPADLFDARRKDTLAIDAQTGRFATNPDVLYFPVLRAEDPAEMVLLCTVLLAEDGGKYHVILNDGQYAALTSHELVMALNLTYEYIGSKVVVRAINEPRL
ncbi:MAG: hypothetical protein KAV00_03385 [Phycisphaerae bacterium]|nr:hypothetical protein [Phycisphaerae bacterium]